VIPVLSFDIETIPDVAGLRALHGLPATLADAEVAEFAFQKQRAKNAAAPAARRRHLLRAAQ
jgi:predicted PolB exonuclease-like 3'-5' exonuclease